MTKKSIRSYNDYEVRAVWDEENSKWWFSATDIVRAINDEENYTKARNYWKYLKGKMAKDGVQLVSVTNHFKFQAPDGKQRAADALDAECVHRSTTDATRIKALLRQAMTDQIDDREIYMKGIDYSYYYEQED